MVCKYHENGLQFRFIINWFSVFESSRQFLKGLRTSLERILERRTSLYTFISCRYFSWWQMINWVTKCNILYDARSILKNRDSCTQRLLAIFAVSQADGYTCIKWFTIFYMVRSLRSPRLVWEDFLFLFRLSSQPGMLCNRVNWLLVKIPI